MTPTTEGDNIGWYLADIDPTGTYNPNSEKQPVIDVLTNTRCSADARFIGIGEMEDPVGKGEWTLVQQHYNSNGIMPGVDPSTNPNFRPYSGPAVEYDYTDYVETRLVTFEVFVDG